MCYSTKIAKHALRVVKDWVRQARAKSTMNISGIITHLVLILAYVIARVLAPHTNDVT